MESNKKYYSISEVSRILKMPQHKLRYMERSSPGKQKINKIKNRRYYTKQDIEQLLQRTQQMFDSVGMAPVIIDNVTPECNIIDHSQTDNMYPESQLSISVSFIPGISEEVIDTKTVSVEFIIRINDLISKFQKLHCKLTNI